MRTQVYVNSGRLVADCPFPGCGDARLVGFGQQQMTCCIGDGQPGDTCPGHTANLEWPEQMPAVLAALAERTSDTRKNWFPRGHPLAVLGGYPHGQTPDELRAETEAGETADAALVADKRAVLIAQLRELGSDDDTIRALRETI